MRVVEIEKFVAEESFERSLRPAIWDEYIGQEGIKKNLQVFIKAAKLRGEHLDHILFFGPPGLGKTTLAHIIANEMEANIKVVAAPMIEKSGDLAAILTNLQNGDILFIDEIHTIVGAGATSGGSMDASNILKPFLTNGKLKLIGATTYEEYRNDFSKDKAFSRRFAKFRIRDKSIKNWDSGKNL